MLLPMNRKPLHPPGGSQFVASPFLFMLWNLSFYDAFGEMRCLPLMLRWIPGNALVLVNLVYGLMFMFRLDILGLTLGLLGEKTICCAFSPLCLPLSVVI